MRPDKTSPWLEVKKLASTLVGAVCLVTGVSVFADTPALNPVKDNTLFEDSPTLFAALLAAIAHKRRIG